MKLSSMGIPYERDLVTSAGGHQWSYFDRMASTALAFIAAHLSGGLDHLLIADLAADSPSVKLAALRHIALVRLGRPESVELIRKGPQQGPGMDLVTFEAFGARP